MKLLYSSLLVCFFCLTASGQIRFHGVLLKDEKTEKPVAVPWTRVTIAGVGGMSTGPDGKFTFLIPRDWPGGTGVQIKVQKTGYLINFPLDGEWNVPSLEEQDVRLLTIIIVPKGSKKLWSNLKIEKELGKLANQIKDLKAENSNPRPIDFEPYFKRWSAETGLTPQEVKALFDAWSASPDATNDPEKRALRAFYRGDYRTAALYFEEAANKTAEERRLYERLVERTERLIERKILETVHELHRAGISWLRVNEYWKALEKFEAAQKEFEAAQKYFPPEKYPQVRAGILRGLSIAQREIGIRSEGGAGTSALRESVRLVTQAAEVYRRAGLAKQLAESETSLGASLYELAIRVGGDEETRLLVESAAACKRALNEQGGDPEQRSAWANTQNMLGLTLTAQAALASPAVGTALFRQATEAFTSAAASELSEGDSEAWANTQINIAQLLDLRANLNHESAPGLLDEAVAARRKALKVFTEQKEPELWAHVVLGLSRSLTLRAEFTLGAEGDGLLNDSESLLQRALGINIRGKLPQPWARTHIELASVRYVRAYRSGSLATASGKALRAELLGKAAAEYRLALEVFTFENFPKDWALTQINLGHVLSDLGEMTDGQPGISLLGEAAQAIRGALRVYSYDGQPGVWLGAQNKLGSVLYEQASRAGGVEGERLMREAVAAYRQAADRSTPEIFLKEWTEAHSELAKIFRETGDGANAVQNYAALLKVYPKHYEALRASSYLYQNVLFNYEKAFETTRRWLELYPHDRRGQVWFAEQHLTTSRFAECERRLNELLAANLFDISEQTTEFMRELTEQPDTGAGAGGLPTIVDMPSESGIRRSLHVVEVVNLIARGRDREVPAKLDWLIQEMEAPGRFVTLNFEGLRHYIENNERLPHHSWLRQFLDSFKKEGYAGGYKALREARDDFKPTGR